ARAGPTKWPSRPRVRNWQCADVGWAGGYHFKSVQIQCSSAAKNMRLIFLGNFVVIVGLNRRNNWRNIRSWERKVSLLHWRCSHSGLAQRYARTPAPICLSLTAHPRRLTITRHHRRALSYLFRQFASASPSVQRLAVITDRDLATTVATGSMVAAVTGADIIGTGTNQRPRRG